ncbi:MAG TPA: hypothetical protein VGK93_04485 [Candidatus Eisenbacteria bacterium]|jgi:hypothetical protein
MWIGAIAVGLGLLSVVDPCTADMVATTTIQWFGRISRIGNGVVEIQKGCGNEAEEIGFADVIRIEVSDRCAAAAGVGKGDNPSDTGTPAVSRTVTLHRTNCGEQRREVYRVKFRGAGTVLIDGVELNEDQVDLKLTNGKGVLRGPKHGILWIKTYCATPAEIERTDSWPAEFSLVP